MKKNQAYHHGDLRNLIVLQATQMIEELGLEGFSIRKLTERAGVSRMAPYHHFKDKSAILAAVAEQGFEKMSGLWSDMQYPSSTRLDITLERYIDFALEHPVQYELMFGRELWRNQPSSALQRRAKDCFRVYAGVIQQMQDDGVLVGDDEPLRMAQVLWSSMHGLVKLAHDGIFVRKEDLKEIALYSMSKYKHA